MIIIRDATMDDCPHIHKLNCEEMGYTYSLEYTKDNLVRILTKKTDKVLVATKNGIVIGYIHANDYEVLYAAPMKNIMGIAVSSEYKRQGVGRMLLQGIEEWAKATGAEAVRLVSGATRTGAHKFYRSCGYEENKQQINFKKTFKPIR